MSQEESIVILLAEDDPAHAEIVHRTMELAQITHRMEHVEDGQQALDYLYQRGHFSDPTLAPRPRLILLDLRMPRIDGLEVLKLIKSDPLMMHIPVIVLTTSAAEADMAKAYDHHANSYLVKPVNFSRFTTMMEAIGSYWLLWNRTPDLSLSNFQR